MVGREPAISLVEERTQHLHVLLESEGWKDVMVPAFRREIERRRKRLETHAFEDLAEVRVTQEEIRLLRKLADEPRAFVRVEEL